MWWPRVMNVSLRAFMEELKVQAGCACCPVRSPCVTVALQEKTCRMAFRGDAAPQGRQQASETVTVPPVAADS